MIPVNITIDGQSVLDDLALCSIKMQEGNFCWTVELELKSKLFWNICDPNKREGIPRIKVIIGETVYSFLCEERTSGREGSSEFTMSVWGRSPQALLTSPYTQAIRREEDEYSSSFLWETEAVAVTDIIDTILADFCEYDVTVTWNAENFLVYPGSLSVEGMTPLEVISLLAEAVGAILTANLDGSLSVDPYDVSEKTPVEVYDDAVAVFSAEENVPVRNGFNAVTVSGTSAGATSIWLSVERKTEDSETDSCFTTVEEEGEIYTYEPLALRVYFFNIDPSASLLYYFPYGSILVGATGVEEITETVQIVFGSGTTSKTNISGETEVLGDPDIPLEYREVTYHVNYQDFVITPEEPGEIGAIFYFDSENYAIYSFTAEDPCNWEDICDGIVLLPDCNYPDDVKYVDGAFSIQILPSRYVKERKETYQSHNWTPTTTQEEIWYEEYNLTLRSLHYDYSMIHSAISQLGLSGKYKNLDYSGTLYGSTTIEGIDMTRPINADELVEELIAYAPPTSKPLETTTAQYDTSYLGPGADFTSSYPLLNIYFENFTLNLVDDYESRNSAVLEAMLSGQWTDIRIDGYYVYGKRKARPSHVTTTRENIVKVRPKQVYYQYTYTGKAVDGTGNYEVYNAAKGELEEFNVNTQKYSYYYDNTVIARAFMELQNSGKWCDLSYNPSTYIISGRRICPVADSECETTLELIGYAPTISDTVTMSRTVRESVDENGTWVLGTAEDEKIVYDYSGLTDLLLSVATSDGWAKIYWDTEGRVYGYRVKSQREGESDYAPGDTIELRVYYDGTSINEQWCSFGDLVFVTSDVEEKEEELTFLNGEASTEFPIHEMVSINYHHRDEDLFPDPTFAQGSKKLRVLFFKGNMSYRTVNAAVVYRTRYDVFRVTIPSDYQGDTFSIGFCFDGCDDPKIVDVSVGYKKGSDITGLRLLHNNNFVGTSPTNTLNVLDGE